MSGAAALDSRRLRVLIVDDHEVVQWGFRLMLGSQPWIERCLGASTGAGAYTLARRYQPHVAVVDLFVGSEAGTDVCRRVLEASPQTRLLMISGAGHISAESVHESGAHGFIAKGLSAEDVARAVRMIAAGLTVFQAGGHEADPQLTSREREVLRGIAEGETNHGIAASLHLSPHTVKGHTSSLYRKLDAKNRAEAVQRAQRLGLVG